MEKVDIFTQKQFKRLHGRNQIRIVCFNIRVAEKFMNRALKLKYLNGLSECVG